MWGVGDHYVLRFGALWRVGFEGVPHGNRQLPSFREVASRKLNEPAVIHLTGNCLFEVNVIFAHLILVMVNTDFSSLQ